MTPQASPVIRHTVLAPVPGEERLQWLDALRGFALFGILMYNVMGFGGYIFHGLPGAPAVRPLDPMFDFLVHALVEAKFYSLFSFLFGLGFAMQLERAERRGASALPVLRRRMFWLLVIGLAHALLIWFGDILSAYAVLGFALLYFRKASPRALLAWALFLLALPLLAYLVFLAVGLGDPTAPDPTQPLEQSLFARLVHAIASGSYAEVVRLNTEFYPHGWLRRAMRLSLPRIMGMFLLGAWAARVGLPALKRIPRTTLRRWLVLGLAVGIPLNIGYALLGSGDALLPASAKGLLTMALATPGIPLLCLAYVAAFALYWRGAANSLLVAAGRMPLTQYVGQSIVCILIFYGFGFGLFGKVGYGGSLLVAVAVYLFLAGFARLWLRSREQGPLETLWRKLSYGRSRETALSAVPAAERD